MAAYRLNPYATFVESHLIPANPQYAVFHRLTGDLVEPRPDVRSLLQAVAGGRQFVFEPDQLTRVGAAGPQIQRLLDKEILIALEADPLSSLAQLYPHRPLQNPAVAYRRADSRMTLVRLSMAERVFSPAPNQRPEIIEEEMPALAELLWTLADGKQTLGQIYATLRPEGPGLEGDEDFRAAIDFLASASRQLIKLAPAGADLLDPYLPFNTVPRNLFHSSKWPAERVENKNGGNEGIEDFHRQGIKDASWEFDVLEPTVNHALRLPSRILGGLDYGARFYTATLNEVGLPAGQINVLEVGGGTGTFAESFINQAQRSEKVNYHILDLSPTLIASQRRRLAGLKASVEHFEQDATEFELPGRRFDLIIANEVIADFPVSVVERKSNVVLSGEGAAYVQKYQLELNAAPARFFVNSGVFRFLERAWLHLRPGGAVVLSEYGSETEYPVESFHLNHAEFSINFGHVAECARKIGFAARLTKLSDFLSIDDNLSVLNGREEHLMCLSHVFSKDGIDLPFALFAESDFAARYAEAAARVQLQPIRFLTLRRNHYYGAKINEFLVLILNKPAA